MKKISLALIFLVAISLACTTQTSTTDSTGTKVYKGVEIDSLKSTATSVREGQQFSVQMIIKNIGEFKAENIRGVLVSNIQTEDIATTSNFIQQLGKNEPRTMIWSINAPTIGIPIDVDYFLNTRVYYNYSSTGFSDVIFIPDNYVGTAGKVISDSSNSPIKIAINSNSPIITYQSSTAFDVTIDIENTGGGRVAYLKDDINEDTSFKSIIKYIEIKYPSTWDLLEEEKWKYTCDRITAAPIKTEDYKFEDRKLSFAETVCFGNSQCGAKCTDGISYTSGTCASGRCSYKAAQACESGSCNADGIACLDTGVVSECTVNSDCGAKCTDGVSYTSGTCATGQCSYSGGQACESNLCDLAGTACLDTSIIVNECTVNSECTGSCESGVFYGPKCVGGVCGLGTGITCVSGVCDGNVCGEEAPVVAQLPPCGNEYIITSSYDDKTKYQRHHLISDNKLSIVLPFSRSLVSTETIENIKISISYGYAIDYPSSLKVTVKGG